VSAKNISDKVVFDAGYWVMVTAYNNQEMDSSSHRVRVVMPPARQFHRSSLLALKQLVSTSPSPGYDKWRTSDGAAEGC